MAAKKTKQGRILVRLINKETGFCYYKFVNKKNRTTKLELKKYDPVLRKHALFRETRSTDSSS